MRYKDFEDFLQTKHAEQYCGTDDLMPDDYEHWLCEELEKEDITNYAESYGKAIKKDILIDIETILYKDHNPKAECECDKCKFFKDIKAVLNK
jgi:hypothetical protein